MTGQIRTYGKVKARRRVYIELSVSPSPRKASHVKPVEIALQGDDSFDNFDHAAAFKSPTKATKQPKLKEIISPIKKGPKLSKSSQKENSVALASLEIARTPVKRQRKNMNLAESPIDKKPVKKAVVKAKQLAVSRKPLADLNLSLSALSLNNSSAEDSLALLLAECGQTKPSNFSASLTPFLASADNRILKIGEATYSEVYQCSSTSEVLKIVPIFPDGAAQKEGTPWASPYADALREVRMSTIVAGYSNSFVSMTKSEVVTGTYPAVLLREWDEYASDSKNDSQNIRPDVFLATQKYLILHLEHVGVDLEHFKFATKSKNSDVLGVFTDVCRALAHAEEIGRFEHRDLHLGNLMIKAQERGGLKTTIIDFGLSRTDQVHCLMDDPGIFNQNKIAKKADIQFDVYDDMRTLTKGDWKGYYPVTNCLWLRFILRKLLDLKGLKKITKGKSAATEVENFALQNLQDTMVLLDQNHELLMGGPRTAKTAKLQTAADILKLL